MFRVFSKFNPLFFRPRIRAAISEFQADLIKSVREAVHMLQVRAPTLALQRLHEASPVAHAVHCRPSSRTAMSRARHGSQPPCVTCRQSQVSRAGVLPSNNMACIDTMECGDGQARSCGPGRSSGSCGS
jgi:hypothetical protein